MTPKQVRAQTIKTVLSTILGIVGIVCVVTGAALVAPAAGFVTAGVFAIALDILVSRPEPPLSEDE